MNVHLFKIYTELKSYFNHLCCLVGVKYYFIYADVYKMRFFMTRIDKPYKKTYIYLFYYEKKKKI